MRAASLRSDQVRKRLATDKPQRYVCSMSVTYYSIMPSPVGPLTLRWCDDALVGVAFETKAQHPRRSQWLQDDARLAPARAQLEQYFRGERTTFDLPLTFSGSSLQERTWRALREIPFGKTWSYSELALHIGEPRWPGARDVGSALNQNPIAVVLPCHRIIGADGELVGFGGGLPRKRWLLTHEGFGAQTTLPGFE